MNNDPRPTEINPQRLVNPNQENIKPVITLIFLFGVLSIVHQFFGKENDYVSDLHSEKNVTLLYPQLKPGDLLEYPRLFKYSHWAVYVGNVTDDKGEIHYKIIHHSTPPLSSPIHVASAVFTGDNSNAAKIREDDLIDPLHSDLVRINNAQDRFWEPFDGDDVVDRARKMMNDPNSEGYDLFKNNCEHFVNKVRYDKLISPQAPKKAIDVIFAATNKNEL